MERRCETCRWWDRQKTTGGKAGLCRVRSPTFFAHHDQGIANYWPATKSDDWCGEWQPKEKADDAGRD
jgi:hypothetical protein